MSIIFDLLKQISSDKVSILTLYALKDDYKVSKDFLKNFIANQIYYYTKLSENRDVEKIENREDTKALSPLLYNK